MGAVVTPPTRRAMTKNGTYTGNGADDRDIDIGVDLSSKNNVWILISSVTAAAIVHRPEQSQGDLSKCFTDPAGAEAANFIQALTSTGFQVGSHARVNQNTIVMRYLTIWEEP